MGQSVAEYSPWELIGERVPTLNPLVLVLQTVKPVLQALTLGIDAQNHPTDEIIGFSNIIVPDSDLQSLFG